MQGNLELKDFNIKEAAKGSGKEIVKKFYANVENNTLEIHFYWAGKGTANIPNNGTYGPLISAITIGMLHFSFLNQHLLFVVYCKV